MGDLSKNFSSSEFECSCGCGLDVMDGTVIDILQKMRDDLGHALTITSGRRCKKKNDELVRMGMGAENSAHLYGYAVDIHCPYSRLRYEILRFLFADTRVTRIGVGSNFIHFDIDTSKPTKVIWTY